MNNVGSGNGDTHVLAWCRKPTKRISTLRQVCVGGGGGLCSMGILEQPVRGHAVKFLSWRELDACVAFAWHHRSNGAERASVTISALLRDEALPGSNKTSSPAT